MMYYIALKDPNTNDIIYIYRSDPPALNASIIYGGKKYIIVGYMPANI